MTAVEPGPADPGSGWPGDPATTRTPVATSAPDVVRLAHTAGDLTALDARVSVCRACPRLVGWREEVARTRRRAYADEAYWGRPVPGWGDPTPGILVVGLAPAAHGGNRTGRIFTGDRSGDWLYAALHRAGLARLPTSTHAGDGQRLTGVRVTAAVHCAPPANDPTRDERDACAAWLDREMGLVAPSLRCVVALGAVGWAAALASCERVGWVAPRPRPRFGHGAEAVLAAPRQGAGPRAATEIRLLGSYHPSQQNTFTGRLTEAMLDEVLARAVAVSRMSRRS